MALELLRKIGYHDSNIEDGLRLSAEKHWEDYGGTPGQLISSRLIDLFVGADASSADQPWRLERLLGLLSMTLRLCPQVTNDILLRISSSRPAVIVTRTGYVRTRRSTTTSGC